MTCECCAELTARVEVLEHEKAELSNLVQGDHHPRLATHDEQIEGILDTQDDHGTTLVQMQAGLQRLNGIALRQMGAIRAIDTNVKAVLDRLPAKRVTP